MENETENEIFEIRKETPAAELSTPEKSEGKSFLPGVVRKYERSGKETIKFVSDVILNIIIILGMVFIIRSFLISPFQVFGPSMCDTMNNFDGECQRGLGEYIIVNKFGYQNFWGLKIGEPTRGDIIVFHPPQNNSEFFIKRVIGLPGETVTLKNGKVYVSNAQNPTGFELNEPYLSSINKNNTHPYTENMTVFVVPQGKYFVLGDNRVASSDSRSCFREGSTETCGQNGMTPFLDMDHIEGKGWLVLWPLSKMSVLQNPVY